MRIKVPALCFVFFSAAFGFAAQPAWELAPPEAKILVGADVRALRNSALTESMTAENRLQMQGAMAALHFPGIELLNDIDSVLFASSGDVPASKVVPVATSKAGSVPAKPRAPFVLVLSGTFPDAHLRPLLKGSHATYKDVSVYRGTGANPISIAILDEHTLLIGDDKSLYRGIDRKTAGVKAQGPLLARAEELAAANDIWMVAHDSSGALQKASGPGAAFASEIEGLDFGVSARTGFNMNFSVDAKTEAGAQMMTKLLMTQMQAAVNSKLNGAKAQDFWRKVKVDTEGKRAQVQIALTKEELRENVRMMQEQRASEPSGGTSVAAGILPAAAAVSAPVAAAPTPKPAGPRVIRIYGLDDGVREIKLDPAN